MTKFESQLEEKTDYELIEIYSSAPDYQPEFIEQVKAHIVKRKIPLNNLSSLSEEEIKQLKAKPAESEEVDSEQPRSGANGYFFALLASLIFTLLTCKTDGFGMYEKHLEIPDIIVRMLVLLVIPAIISWPITFWGKERFSDVFRKTSFIFFSLVLFLLWFGSNH